MKTIRKWVRKKMFRFFIYVICVALAFILIFLLMMTLSEYTPKDVEDAERMKKNPSQKALDISKPLSITSYNIGYCNDSFDSDFFMDGGRRTRIESVNKVERNMRGIAENLYAAGSDINLIQEVDIDSKRGYHTNQVKYFCDNLDGSGYFAKNFSVSYIPYPIPDTIGKIESGLLTMNPYAVTDAKRYSLPVSFKFPVRVFQMKRCLLVERIKIRGSKKELVLINQHLEAYDSGAGKAAQMKVLTDLMKKEYKKGNYVIVGGDFNHTFPNVDNSKYPIINDKYYVPAKIEKNTFGKGWTIAADGSVPTSRLLNEEYNPESENTQYYVIDGFVLSPNVKLKKIKTMDTGFNYSDHNPVRIDVTFEK